MLQQNMERIALQIASIRLAETKDWRVYQEWIRNIIDSDAGRDLVYIAIFNDAREIVTYALNPQFLDIDNAGLLTRREETEIVRQLSNGQVAEESWQDFDHIPVNIRWGSESLGKVDVGFSLIDFNNRVQARLRTNIWLMLNALVLGVLLSIWMGRRITKPLDHLSAGMQEVSRGYLDFEIVRHSSDEIGDLSRSFNVMTRRLRDKAVLENFSRDLVYVADREAVIRMVTERIVDYAGAQQGVFFLFDENKKHSTAVSVWSHPAELSETIEIDIDESCRVDCLGRTMPFPPAEIIHLFSVKRALVKIRRQLPDVMFELVLPLLSQGEVIGFIILASPKSSDDNQKTDPIYSRTEIQFLQTLAQQAAMAVRNATLLRELTEQERIKKELEIARNVQQRLLPVKAPRMDGVELSGFCCPATEVGGDYYDYFIIDSHRIGLAIADVTGKGTSAAFYMAELKGMMTSLAYTDMSPKEIIGQLNTYLTENIDKRVFATMIYGILDLQKKTFTFVRAGHNALVIKHTREQESMEICIPEGLGIGLTNDVVYTEHTEQMTIDVHTGDILVLYTDGLSESMNEHYEEFAEERLYRLVSGSEQQTTEQLKDEILAAVNEFVGDAPQHDDITMVLARIL